MSLGANLCVRCVLPRHCQLIGIRSVVVIIARISMPVRTNILSLLNAITTSLY